jgi:hypothetical protein
MQRGVIAYIVAFVVLVIIVLYIESTLPKSTSSSTTTHPPPSSSNTPKSNSTTPGPKNSTNTTVGTPNQTSPTNTSTPYNYTGCIKPGTNVTIPNGNFSYGNYTDWSVNGTGWGSVPVNLTLANQNMQYPSAPWSNASSAYFATTFTGGIRPAPGNLTSAPFEVVEPYLNFRLISPPDDQIYIELLSNNTPIMIVHYDTYAAPNNTNEQSTFEPATILLSNFLCRQIQIKAVVGAVSKVGGYDYIAVTGFQLSKMPAATNQVIVLNQSFPG